MQFIIVIMSTLQTLHFSKTPKQSNQGQIFIPPQLVSRIKMQLDLASLCWISSLELVMQMLHFPALSRKDLVYMV